LAFGERKNSIKYNVFHASKCDIIGPTNLLLLAAGQKQSRGGFASLYLLAFIVPLLLAVESVEEELKGLAHSLTY
jgi:hypothetical protein